MRYKRPKNFNTEYALLAGFYNMAFAGLSSFAMIFLLDRGLNNSQAGYALSFSALVSAIFQPWIAEKVDSDTEHNIFYYNKIMIVLPIILLLKMLIFPTNSAFAVLDFIIVYILIWTITPLLNGIFSYLKIHQLTINYGYGRSFGSFTAALSSSLLGLLINKNIMVVIIFTLVSIFLYFIAIHYSEKKSIFIINENYNKVTKKDNNQKLSVFFKSNKNFVLFLIGTIFLLTFHYIINYFMYQIVLSVGGNERHVGIALGIGALVTIPVISSYEQLLNYISNKQALIISSFFFILRAILILFASNIYLIYIAEFFQAFSYGLYSAASVYLVTENIDNNYQNIGQSLVTSAATIGGVVGPFVGGIIVELFSVQLLLLICLSITMLGFSFYLFSLKENAVTES